jgi:hypothetical protein
MARHSGIAAVEKYGGVPFTLRQPHVTNVNDQVVFGSSKHSNKGDGDGQETVLLDSGFANDAVMACIIPTRSLSLLPGYENDKGLFRVSVESLVAMRPVAFSGVVNKAPWLAGVVLLPPTCICRSFSLVEMSSGLGSRLETERTDWGALNGIRSTTMAMLSQPVQPPRPKEQKTRYSDFINSMSSEWVYESGYRKFSGQGTPVKIIKVNSVLDYIEGMRELRKRAANLDVFPLYHYTQSCVLPLILSDGLRMSTQGQGDGGVYFSTKGPASYKLGSSKYEFNIIRDCFGLHRLTEFMGLGKLNAVIVYGCSHHILQQAPGGRVHAKLVPRSLFEDFSLPNSDGDFYLRSDNILAAFEIDGNNPPSRASWYLHDMELEAEIDDGIAKEIDAMQHALGKAADRVELIVKEFGNETGDEEYDDEEDDGQITDGDNDIEMRAVHSMNPIRKSSLSAQTPILRPETSGTSEASQRDFSVYRSVQFTRGNTPPRTAVSREEGESKTTRPSLVTEENDL